jgi:hypothetical protein
MYHGGDISLQDKCGEFDSLRLHEIKWACNLIVEISLIREMS